MIGNISRVLFQLILWNNGPVRITMASQAFNKPNKASLMFFTKSYSWKRRTKNIKKTMTIEKIKSKCYWVSFVNYNFLMIKGLRRLRGLYSSLKKMRCFTCFITFIRIGWSMCWRSLLGPRKIVLRKRSSCLCFIWIGSCSKTSQILMKRWCLGNAF